MFARHGRSALAIGAIAFLAGCAGSVKPHVPVPDDPGLYALMHDDDLEQLDRDEESDHSGWSEWSDLDPDQQFVIADPMLVDRGTTDVAIELWQVSWLRSDIRSDGSAAPVHGQQWVVAPVESARVPLSFRPVAGNPDVVHVVPQRALDPGLYALQLRRGDAGRTARFGVGWSDVDQRDYAADHCVDRKASIPTTFHPCPGADTAAAAAQGATPGPGGDLRIELDKPVAATVAGQRVLVVEGEVRNLAGISRAVPLLQAALHDHSGNVLGRWTFAASPNLLAPGESATFRTEIEDPPAGTSRVDVNFQPDAAM